MSIVYHTATDQRVETSAAEQAFLAALQAAGVPVVPGVKLGQNWVFDGAVNGTKLLIEYHGGHWHSIPEVAARDGRKQVWAHREGYLIVTVWHEDAEADLAGEIDRVVAIYQGVVASAPAPGAVHTDESDTLPALPAGHYGDWRDRFLEALSEGGIVREACIAAGVSRQTAYVAKQDDLVFAEHWRLALQDAADKALSVYRRRAIQQSDRAMEFFITTRDPELRAPQRVEVTGAEGGPIDIATMSDAERAERLAAILERGRQRAAADPDGRP